MELKEGREVIFSDVEVDKMEVNDERCKPGKRKAVRTRKGCSQSGPEIPEGERRNFQPTMMNVLRIFLTLKVNMLMIT